MFLSYLAVYGQVPKWFQSTRHPDYPAERYLIGIGISESREAAVELARADVAKQIRVQIESELKTVESEFQGEHSDYLRSEVTSTTKSVVTETVAGIEIAIVEKVKNNNYALAVLNKHNFLSSLKTELQKIIKDTQNYMNAARSLAREGQILGSIDNYLDAQNTITLIYPKRALYTALSGETITLPAELYASAILSEIRKLLSRLQIEPVSGNGQTATPGRELNEPLVARVFYRTEENKAVGVYWYPVIVRYANGEVIKRFSSGNDGLVSINVIATPTGTTGESGSVDFEMGSQKLPDALRENLSATAATFKYFLETVTLTFAIEISTPSDEARQVISDQVTSWITGAGHAIQKGSRNSINCSLNIAKEKSINLPAGTQHYIESQLDMTLIDGSNGNKLASIRASGKGIALNNRDEAILNSCRKLNVSKGNFSAFLQKAAQ